MKRLIIIGASGHGKVIADIANLRGYTDIVFLDNNPDIKECVGYPVLGPDTMTSSLDGEVFIAVGNKDDRRRLLQRETERVVPTLIHPCAVVAEGTIIDKGTVVMAGVVINPGTRIGKGCIINTSSSIDHDCIIGDYSHISVGSHLSGTVSVGENTWIGAGATVINNINICKNSVIGAGAVVIRDIDRSGIYVGIPAVKLERDVIS